MWDIREGHVREVVGCSCRVDGGFKLGRKVAFGGGMTGSYGLWELLCGGIGSHVVGLIERYAHNLHR